MDDLSVEAKVALAGFAGAAVSLKFLKSLTPVQWVMTLAGGAASSWYLARWVAYVLGVPTDYLTVVGFLIGLFGLAISGALIEAITNADIWGFVKEFITKKWGG